MRHRKTLVSVLLFSTAAVAATASPAAASPTPPPPDHRVPPALLELRGRLAETPLADALKAGPTFRPLCDADGYPLVGNLATKSPVLTRPSAFCAAVRDAEGRK